MKNNSLLQGSKETVLEEVINNLLIKLWQYHEIDFMCPVMEEIRL